jgi:hypothetical protein
MVAPDLLVWGFFMLNKLGYIIVFVFLTFNGYAQKVINKSWDTGGIERLEIISNEIFNIVIISSNTTSINVVTKIEGEHYKNVVLNISEENNTLTLSTGFTPYFQAVNDKLAAHKVISIEMELKISNRLEVFVRSSTTSLTTHGSFKDLVVELGDGNCVLNDFEGNAQLLTIDGNITVIAHNTVKAKGETRKGKLTNELSTSGNFSIDAESVNGDITLLKSQ